MSFLTRAHPIIRQAAIARSAPRLFSTTVVYQKGPVETAKDALKAVDRTVSDAAVAGIDKGIEVKDKAASAAGVNADEAKGEASKLAGQAQGKAEELKGKAKGAAEEAKAKI